MSFNTHNIYHPLIVNSGWTSQSVSATTISAGTFYGGSLSANYVGNQNVTDQEFKYLSGVTSNIQTQINLLPSKSEPFITYRNSGFLTNEMTLSASSGINFSQTISNVSFDSYLSSLEFDRTSISFNSTQTAITNWNPTNFQVNDNIRATHIIITGNSTVYPSIISGLVGGTSGRVVIITNLSNQLYIFENKSSKCNIGNQFNFKSGKAYLLGMSNQTITLIYNSNDGIWDDIGEGQYYTNFQDFNCRPRYFINRRDPSTTFRSESGTGCPPFYFKFNGGVLPIITGFTGNETCVAFGPNATYGVGRTNGRLPSLGTTIARIKLSNEFNYVNISTTNTPYFTNNYDLRRYDQIGTIAFGGNNMKWFLNSSGYWVNSVSSYSNSGITSVSISETVNNFVTLGIHLPLNTAVEGTVYSFFYSFDDNEYNWSNFIVGSININNAGQLNIGVIGATTVNYLICDYIGIINPSFFMR